MPYKAVYFFCMNANRDPVAPQVWESCRTHFDPQPTGMTVDGRNVLEHADSEGNRYLLVPTEEVLSHDYPRYLPLLRNPAYQADFAGLVNWHEGMNAPERIFTLHTTGDVPSGIFGPADASHARRLLLSMERHRQQAGLMDWRTITEATHWSGAMYGLQPSLLMEYKTPLMDIELGSSTPSWSNPEAAEALARALMDSFQIDPGRPTNVLCVGGVHFEQAFADAVLANAEETWAVSHILPNQWIVAGDYANGSAVARLRTCSDSIVGGIQAIAYHDNLKGCYKEPLRQLGAVLNVPVIKHKALRGKGGGK